MVWKNFAPPKATATAWRLLWGRLHRKVIESDADAKCLACGMEKESALHLFIECSLATLIWAEIYKWCKVSMVAHNTRLRDHFIQNSTILCKLVGEKKWLIVFGFAWFGWCWNGEIMIALRNKNGIGRRSSRKLKGGYEVGVQRKMGIRFNVGPYKW